MKWTKGGMNAHDLKGRIDLRSIAEQLLGTPARRSYQYLQFRAPDRDERTPSLTVWADGYKDFGASDQHGDIFDFLATYGNQSFQEALAFLDGAERFSPPSSPIQASPRRVSSAPDPTWQQAAQTALQHCQRFLMKTPAARQYLYDQGYTNATIELRGLGFNPQWKRLNWKKPDGKAAWLPPGIVFPWYRNGQLYALKVRTAHGTHDQPDAVARLLNRPPEPMKYMQVAGGRISQAWYGTVGEAKQPVIFCEGEKDCDNLSQALAKRAAVLTLGSATGRLPEALLDHLQHAAWVGVVLDNDEAGQSNAIRLHTQLRQHLDTPVIIGQVPPEHKDITDWILAGGDVGAWFDTLAAQSVFVGWEVQHATYFVQGVPDLLRETILGLHQLARAYVKDQANAALVLELWHEAVLQHQLDPNAPVTVAQLMACQTRSTTSTSIRRGLEQLVGLGLVDLLSNCPPSIPNNFLIEGDESAKKTPRGRPSLCYQFRRIPEALTALQGQLEQRLRESIFANELPDHPQPEWFEQWVEPAEAQRLAHLVEQQSEPLYDAHAYTLARAEILIKRQVQTWRNKLNASNLAVAVSTPINASLTYSCGREYRDAYYHALIEDAGPYGRQISRREASTQIGVSSRTLSRIRRRVKVIAEPRFRNFQLHDSQAVAVTADSLAPWAAQRTYGRYLESSSGACVRLRVDDESRNSHWVATQLAHGYRVWLKVQVASLERFATEEEITADDSAQTPAGSNHLSYNHQPSAEICPKGVTLGYVRDQMWLRRDAVRSLVAGDTILREVLQAMGLLE